MNKLYAMIKVNSMRRGALRYRTHLTRTLAEQEQETFTLDEVRDIMNRTATQFTDKTFDMELLRYKGNLANKSNNT